MLGSWDPQTRVLDRMVKERSEARVQVPNYQFTLHQTICDVGYYNITIFITIFISIVIIQHTKFLAVQYNDCHILGIKPTGWTHSRAEGQESSLSGLQTLTQSWPWVLFPRISRVLYPCFLPGLGYVNVVTIHTDGII